VYETVKEKASLSRCPCPSTATNSGLKFSVIIAPK